MDEMKTPSIVVHKGEKEEKYHIYIEDYVISYLKYEAGKLELSEIFFYGRRKDGSKKYMIYGAGKDKHIPLFDKYDLLGEVGCRLTQAGPFFIIREADNTYEVKGYDIFYQTNEEMQSYLINAKEAEAKEENGKKETREEKAREEKADKFAKKLPAKEIEKDEKPQSWISLQLFAVFILLVAIVITSTDSYDKMNQLNQSAKEVFFAMENQAVQKKMEKGEIVGDSMEDIPQDDIEMNDGLQEENANAKTDGEGAPSDKTGADETVMPDEETEKPEEEKPEEEKTGEEKPEKVQTEETAQTGQEETSADQSGQKEEALSRSVVRYYEIEKGDTLYGISKKIYGDTSKVEQICALNEISDPDNINYGQKIILP